MSVVSLDDLELALRRLPGVVAVGFVETDDLVLVEVQAGPDAYDDLARDATVLAAEHVGGRVAVEVVRWGDGGRPRARDARLRLVELTTDPGVGELSVRLARGDEEAIGRASTAGGLPAAVEATIVAVRTLRPRARRSCPAGRARSRPLPTGGSSWSRRSPTRSRARTAAAGRRGRHPHRGRRPRHPRRAEPHHQPRPLTPPTTRLRHFRYVSDALR